MLMSHFSDKCTFFCYRTTSFLLFLFCVFVPFPFQSRCQRPPAAPSREELDASRLLEGARAGGTGALWGVRRRGEAYVGALFLSFIVPFIIFSHLLLCLLVYLIIIVLILSPPVPVEEERKRRE